MQAKAGRLDDPIKPWYWELGSQPCWLFRGELVLAGLAKLFRGDHALAVGHLVAYRGEGGHVLDLVSVLVFRLPIECLPLAVERTSYPR